MYYEHIQTYGHYTKTAHPFRLYAVFYVYVYIEIQYKQLLLLYNTLYTGPVYLNQVIRFYTVGCGIKLKKKPVSFIIRFARMFFCYIEFKQTPLCDKDIVLDCGFF